MKASIYLAVLFLISVGMISCEKVIDINLDKAESKLVIEANITNSTDSQLVIISRSVPFDQSNDFPAVSGAVVHIADDNGRIFPLVEKEPGIYIARRLTGRPGVTYYLRVLVDDKEYIASSKMPNQVDIDSLGITVNTFFDEEQKVVQAVYSDPAEVKNYYRFLLSINGIKTESYFVFDDNFTDGRSVVRDLFDFDLEPETGDEATIVMQCIDPVMYRYWVGQSQNESRGGASTIPANPVTNISNGALGYFSAHTSQKEVIEIP